MKTGTWWEKTCARCSCTRRAHWFGKYGLSHCGSCGITFCNEFIDQEPTQVPKLLSGVVTVTEQKITFENLRQERISIVTSTCHLCSHYYEGIEFRCPYLALHSNIRVFICFLCVKLGLKMVEGGRAEHLGGNLVTSDGQGRQGTKKAITRRAPGREVEVQAHAESTKKRSK